MNDIRLQPLDQLIASAVEDPSLEDALFVRLLESTLYVHSPKRRTGAKLALVQFRTPQGVLAIPVFTDRKKSEFAGRGNVRTVPIRGRELLEATQGANIVINPNDAWCILYPEEIQTLLKGGRLGRTPTRLEGMKTPQLRPASDVQPTFLNALVASLASSNHALDAWLTEAEVTEPGAVARYIVVVAAEKPHHERLARTITLDLSDVGPTLDAIVDIAFIEPGKEHASWLRDNAECLIYSRPRDLEFPSGFSGRA